MFCSLNVPPKATGIESNNQCQTKDSLLKCHNNHAVTFLVMSWLVKNKYWRVMNTSPPLSHWIPCYKWPFYLIISNKQVVLPCPCFTIMEFISSLVLFLLFDQHFKSTLQLVVMEIITNNSMTLCDQRTESFSCRKIRLWQIELWNYSLCKRCLKRQHRLYLY